MRLFPCRLFLPKEEELSIATGHLAYPYIKRMAEAIEEAFPHKKIHVYDIRNDFFGEMITVTGLLTGCGNAVGESEIQSVSVQSEALSDVDDSEKDNAKAEGTIKADDTELRDTEKTEDIAWKDTIEIDFGYDYTEDIKADVNYVVLNASSLQEELENMDAITQKYMALSEAAETQGEMNIASKWFYVIWDTELNNLWGRFSELADEDTKEKVLESISSGTKATYLLNGVIISTIFIIFFNNTGTLNTILEWLNLQPLQHHWLQDLDLVNPAVASISIWRYYGMNFIMFFGALQSIPSELYEAATLDGCTKMQEIRYISIPSIKKVLFINILLSVSGSIQVFEIPYIMLNGSNGTSTPVIMIQQSMSENRVGFAAALSVMVFVIVLIVVGLQKLLVKED